jgi:hypothetical protein
MHDLVQDRLRYALKWAIQWQQTLRPTQVAEAVLDMHRLP